MEWNGMEWNVRMYVMYVCTHACVRACMHACINIMYVCIYIHTSIYSDFMWLLNSKLMCIYIYSNIHIFIWRFPKMRIPGYPIYHQFSWNFQPPSLRRWPFLRSPSSCRARIHPRRFSGAFFSPSSGREFPTCSWPKSTNTPSISQPNSIKSGFMLTSCSWYLMYLRVHISYPLVN